MSAKVISISAAGRRMRLVARNRLAAEHEYLVTLVAKQIGSRLPPCFDLTDLISAGMQGLVKARDLYDPLNHHDTPFRHFCKHYIRGAILDSIRRRHWTEATHAPLEFRTSAEREGATSADLLEEPSHTPDLVGELAMTRAIELLRQELEYLPEPGRSVVRMYYLESMRLPDVARAAGISEYSVAGIRDAAIAELRRRLSWQGLRSAA